MQALGDPDVKEASFASYADSMRSFIEDYGNLVQGASNPAQFARSLQNSGKFGINPDGTKVPTYVSDMVGTIQHLSPFIARAKLK